MSGIVRVASEPKSPAPSSQPSEKGSEGVIVSNGKPTDIPPTEYSKTGKPYLAKALEIENVYSELDQEQQTDAEFIDEYFQELQVQGKYENDSIGYKEFMKKMEKLVGVKHATLNNKLGKIAEFIKYTKRTAKYE